MSQQGVLTRMATVGPPDWIRRAQNLESHNFPYRSRPEESTFAGQMSRNLIQANLVSTWIPLHGLSVHKSPCLTSENVYWTSGTSRVWWTDKQRKSPWTYAESGEVQRSEDMPSLWQSPSSSQAEYADRKRLGYARSLELICNFFYFHASSRLRMQFEKNRMHPIACIFELAFFLAKSNSF